MVSLLNDHRLFKRQSALDTLLYGDDMTGFYDITFVSNPGWNANEFSAIPLLLDGILCFLFLSTFKLGL
jgi:hypothetical protein